MLHNISKPLALRGSNPMERGQGQLMVVEDAPVPFQ